MIRREGIIRHWKALWWGLCSSRVGDGVCPGPLVPVCSVYHSSVWAANNRGRGLGVGIRTRRRRVLEYPIFNWGVVGLNEGGVRCGGVS